MIVPGNWDYLLLNPLFKNFIYLYLLFQQIFAKVHNRNLVGKEDRKMGNEKFYIQQTFLFTSQWNAVIITILCCYISCYGHF